MPRVSVEVSYFRRVFAGFTVMDNLNLAPSNFDQFSVIAPVDSRLGDRSGQTITGFYDTNNASKSLAVNNSTVLVKDLPGNPNQIQHWNGVDFSANARLQNGILLQGGISTGRTSTNNCDVVALVPESLGNTAQADCAVTTQFLTQAKVIAVYTVPKIAVQIAGDVPEPAGHQPDVDVHPDVREQQRGPGRSPGRRDPRPHLERARADRRPRTCCQAIRRSCRSG